MSRGKGQDVRPQQISRHQTNMEIRRGAALRADLHLPLRPIVGCEKLLQQMTSEQVRESLQAVGRILHPDNDGGLSGLYMLLLNKDYDAFDRALTERLRRSQ